MSRTHVNCTGTTINQTPDTEDVIIILSNVLFIGIPKNRKPTTFSCCINKRFNMLTTRTFEHSQCIVRVAIDHITNLTRQFTGVIML